MSDAFFADSAGCMQSLVNHVPSCIRSNSYTIARGDGEGATGGGKHDE